jgi:hypothetical protein
MGSDFTMNDGQILKSQRVAGYQKMIYHTLGIVFMV